jgi:type I restriction enzyme S subunit
MSQPDYKDTVKSWLGDVPTSWQVQRLKTVIAQPITDGPHETPEFLSEGIPFLSVDGIQNGDLVFDGCRYISQAAHKEYQRKCAPCYNDILLGKAASTGKIARVKVDFDFSIWSPLALIRPNQSEVRPDFLEYSLKSVATQAQIDCLCTANTQKNISMQDIPSLVLCVPPFQNQIDIAAYLDEQTAKIDQLMDMRRRQMALLKEQRTALIQEAVTRGLNPNVPMKDSGLPWLGEIPAHWRCAPLRRFWMVLDCKHLTVPFLDEGYPLASVTEVQSFELDLSKAKRTSEEFWRQLIEGDRQPLPGDLIYCRNTSVGAAAFVSSDEPIAMGQDVCLIRSRKQNNRYLNYVLRSRFMIEQLNTIIVGATFKRINVVDIKALIVLCPPKSEQDEIVEFIESQTAKFDALHAAYTRQLTLLTEYRAALIHECVTGQRTVPEIDYA